jgi:hypothetical protein
MRDNGKLTTRGCGQGLGDRHDVIRRRIANPYPPMRVVTAPAHSTVPVLCSYPELRGDLSLVTALVAPDDDELMTMRGRGWHHAIQHGQHRRSRP